MKTFIFPFAVTTAILASGLLFADEAANAYVTVSAPKAKASSGVDFAIDGKGDSVSVGIKAQPGWVLTSPSVQNIPKGQAGYWKAKSFYGESDGEGEICIPVESVSTNHVSAPHFPLHVNVSCIQNNGNGNNGNNGNIGVGQGNEHVGEGNNGNGKGIPGNDPSKNGKKGNGAVLSFTSDPGNLTNGRHKIVIDRESCPGGKTNKKTHETNNSEIVPDIYQWSWSCGPHSGTETGESIAVGPLNLDAGKYTLAVTLTVKSSICPACTYTKTQTRNLNVK